MNIAYYVGACDKSDMLLAVAALLSRLERKVLLIDGTTLGWLKFRNGAWVTKEQWVAWNGWDCASGVRDWNEVEALVQALHIDLEGYDNIIIDTDQIDFYPAERFSSLDEKYLVLTAETSSIHRHLEWMMLYELQHQRDINDQLQFIIMHAADPQEDRRYVEQVLTSAGVHSTREPLVIPYEESDWIAKLRSDTRQTIELKLYARSTRDVWRELVESSAGPLTDKIWRTIIKRSLRGSRHHEAI